MKKRCCTVVLALFLATAGYAAQAQSPAPIRPGTPPAVQFETPGEVAPAPTMVKKTVVHRRRGRSRGGSDDIANQLNAQEITGGALNPAVAPAYAPVAYPPPLLGAAYSAPAYYPPPPPPVWYPPPRPWPFWRPWPWWRPWRPFW